MSDGPSQPSSSASTKRVALSCPAFTRITSFEIHDSDGSTFDALSTAVHGASELLKNSQASSDITSPSGETDDGERKHPHSSAKSSKTRSSTAKLSTSHRPQDHRVESDALDMGGYYTLEAFEACELVTSNPTPAPATTTTTVAAPVTATAETTTTTMTSSPPTSTTSTTSATSRLRRPSSKARGATVTMTAVGPTTTSPGNSATTPRKAGGTPHSAPGPAHSAQTSFPPPRPPASKTASSPVSTVLPTVVAPAAARSQVVRKADVTGPAVEPVLLPQLCAEPTVVESPNRRALRIPSPSLTAPRHSLSEASDGCLRTPTHAAAAGSSSGGQDALVDFLNAAWRQRAPSQFSVGDSQGGASPLSPRGGLQASGYSQRLGMRLSISEQLSVASDATFVDHGESCLFSSLRTIGSTSNNAVVAAALSNYQVGEAGTGHATPQRRHDEAVCGSTRRSVHRAAASQSQPPDALSHGMPRALHLPSPAAAATATAAVTAGGVASAVHVSSSATKQCMTGPVTPRGVPSSGTARPGPHPVPVHTDEESDSDMPGASAMTARPSRSRLRGSPGSASTAPKATTGRDVTSATSSRVSEGRQSGEGKKSSSASRRRQRHEDKSTTATSSASSRDRASLSHRTAASTAQYREAVEYARNRDYSLTVRELLAKGMARGAVDEDDEDDADEDEDDGCRHTQ